MEKQNRRGLLAGLGASHNSGSAIARICNSIQGEKARFYVPDWAQHQTGLSLAEGARFYTGTKILANAATSWWCTIARQFLANRERQLLPGRAAEVALFWHHWELEPLVLDRLTGAVKAAAGGVT